MTVSADIKCEFSRLKYEQLLSDKYFIETCFSKKSDCVSSKRKLVEMAVRIKRSK